MYGFKSQKGNVLSQQEHSSLSLFLWFLFLSSSFSGSAGKPAQVLAQRPGGPGDEDQRDGPRHARAVLRRGGGDHPTTDGGGPEAQPHSGVAGDTAEEPGGCRQGRLLPGQQDLQAGP